MHNDRISTRTQTRDTTMSNFTKIAFAAALILGAASAALAGTECDDPTSAGQAERDWQEWQQGVFQHHMSNGDSAYGYFGLPGQTEPSKKNR
jgi:hypothetical protein